MGAVLASRLLVALGGVGFRARSRSSILGLGFRAEPIPASLSLLVGLGGDGDSALGFRAVSALRFFPQEVRVPGSGLPLVNRGKGIPRKG